MLIDAADLITPASPRPTWQLPPRTVSCMTAAHVELRSLTDSSFCTVCSWAVLPSSPPSASWRCGWRRYGLMPAQHCRLPNSRRTLNLYCTLMIAGLKLALVDRTKAEPHRGQIVNPCLLVSHRSFTSPLVCPLCARLAGPVHLMPPTMVSPQPSGSLSSHCALTARHLEISAMDLPTAVIDSSLFACRPRLHPADVSCSAVPALDTFSHPAATCQRGRIIP
jgi:hypothetical protein